MSINELEKKAKEIQELKRMKEELEAEITSLEDEIKNHLGEAEEVTAGAFKIRWKTVFSSRFDTKGFKAAAPEMFEKFSISTKTRRFSIS